MRRLINVASVFLLTGISVAMVASAGEVKLRWIMPTNNVDGSPLTGLSGAKVYYGTSSSNYSVIIDVGFTNACTITNLSAGATYYFSGTAYNSDGLESDFCGEVVRTAPLLPSMPKPPSSPRVVSSTSEVVIVDNTETEKVALVGSWTLSSWAPAYYGGNYFHDGSAGKGSKSVTFRPNLPVNGRYAVYLWWPAQQASYAWASNAPVDIVSSTGTNTVLVNQKVNGSKWVALSTNTFTAGTGGYVRIRTDNTAGAYVIADSVRFMRVSGF